jgi:hypothetical protein
VQATLEAKLDRIALVGEAGCVEPLVTGAVRYEWSRLSTIGARARARADTDARPSLVISADDVDHRLQARGGGGSALGSQAVHGYGRACLTVARHRCRRTPPGLCAGALLLRVHAARRVGADCHRNGASGLKPSPPPAPAHHADRSSASCPAR